ncbi:MAG: murein hydrolase activator EnvC family protein [Prevotella sp.]
MKVRVWLLLLMAMLVAVPGVSQQQRSRNAATKVQSKKSSAQQKTSTRKRTTKKASASQKTAKQPTSSSIKGLKSQSAQIKKNIREQEQKLRTNERNVKQRLQNLMVINSEIVDKKRTIDTIRKDINELDGNILLLNKRIERLEAELADRKEKYVKSMRYMHRNRSIQSQLMFIFSAQNFTRMYRRLRFTREYAAFQRSQGEMVKAKRAQVQEQREELKAAKQRKNVLLNRGIVEHKSLEGKQVEQEKVVKTLQNQQKTIQRIIDEQRKKQAAIDAEIDRLVAIEIEKARKRAEEEARQRALAEEAARRRAEEARRKAADEVSKKPESSASSDRKRGGKTEASSKPLQFLTAEDQRISGSFASNKGRLPIPVTGGYRIVSRYGQYNVEGLKNVRLDNKGINIQATPGAQVRSIFDGEVSAVFNAGGSSGVMIRHGSYISVYCNLGSVFVRRGQKVSTRQSIGTLGPDNVLQFQLRKEKAKINPELWLGR